MLPYPIVFGFTAKIHRIIETTNETTKKLWKRESAATHKNMYKFRKITLTKKESSRRYIQASRVCFCVFREFCVR